MFPCVNLQAGVLPLGKHDQGGKTHLFTRAQEYVDDDVLKIVPNTFSQSAGSEPIASPHMTLAALQEEKRAAALRGKQKQ